MQQSTIAILADFPWSFFSAGATGRGGGQACTWLAQLAGAFSSERRYRIHWVSLDRSLWCGRVMRHEWGGQLFTKIPAGRLKIDLASGYRLSRWLLGRELRRIKPDLIHCWGTERSYPIACGFRSLPSVLSMQGVIGNLHRCGYLPDIWAWRQMAEWEPFLLRRATLVTCESAWARDRVSEEAPATDVRLVEYGVHPSFYDLKWNPDIANPYAVFVGSLAPYKGVRELLDALRSLSDRRWKFKFIGGDGPLMGEVRDSGIAGVEFLGSLAWSELQAELCGATCLVHPTFADSSPNVVKEARVIGLPVITTPHGGQAGYILDGQNGIIVDPVQAAGLADALASLMGDPAKARVMGASRHEIDRAYFRPERTANAFISLYDEILGGELRITKTR